MGKKIAKLTWLHNGNYGSVLQALALQDFLRGNGYDVEDLNYRASLKTKLLNWLCNGNSPKLFLGKFQEIKRKKGYANPEKFVSREKKFFDFKNKNIKTSRLCQTPKELENIASEYDAFICGSDQIWSPVLMNPVFYLTFVKENQPKIAYAPSFGVTSVKGRKRQKIANYIQSFDFVSVRELQGQQLVRELTTLDVPVQVDPTLLLTAEKWTTYASEPLIDKPYVFCYLLTPNPVYVQSVREFARQKNLPVIIVPTVKGPFATGFDEKVDVGPAEWLSLIKNAAYVCTDSFHGCIFSAIFHREFFLYKRFDDNNKNSENSRVYTLTALLQIQDRLLDETTLHTMCYLKALDFSAMDRIICEEAKKSGDWLLNALKNTI